MEKKIVGYRVVYEDPFDGLRGIIAEIHGDLDP